jgi:hypothetical protein
LQSAEYQAKEYQLIPGENQSNPNMKNIGALSTLILVTQYFTLKKHLQNMNQILALTSLFHPESAR